MHPEWKKERYVLLNMGIFQPTMLYYRRLRSFPANKTTWKTPWPAPASMGRSAHQLMAAQPQPIWKMCASQIGSFPHGWKVQKCLSCHHLVMLGVSDAWKVMLVENGVESIQQCVVKDFLKPSCCLHRVHFCSRPQNYTKCVYPCMDGDHANCGWHGEKKHLFIKLSMFSWKIQAWNYSGVFGGVWTMIACHHLQLPGNLLVTSFWSFQ